MPRLGPSTPARKALARLICAAQLTDASPIPRGCGPRSGEGPNEERDFLAFRAMVLALSVAAKAGFEDEGEGGPFDGEADFAVAGFETVILSTVEA